MRVVTAPITFMYGTGDDAVELTVDVPAWQCDVCGGLLTREGSEAAQHEAICKHLGRITPAEIVSLRTRLNLTQTEFAERLGVSRPSIARWETGTQIQSAFHDRALRDALRWDEVAKIHKVFRTDVSDRRPAASKFILRRLAA